MADESVDPGIADEAKRRLALARRQKALFEPDLRECYWFAAPLLDRTITSQSSSEPYRPRDAAELSTQLAMEVTDDFATEAINTYLPETGGWYALKPSVSVKLADAAAAAALKGQIGQTEATIADMIASSNFHARLPQAFVPDGTIGTVAMHIDDQRPGEPTVCQSIPLSELEINVGPFGDVDDRFIVRRTRYRYLEALIGDLLAAAPREIQDKEKNRPNDRCELRWGWWRDWSDKGDVAWHHVVMVGPHLLKSTTLKGWGSCPLIIGRFNPNPLFPFGNGPLLKALPNLRTIDEATALTLERFEIAAHPPFGYPDDGVVNFEGGIGPGEGVPMRPGSGRDFVKLFFEGDPNIQFLVQADLEKQVRRTFYADYPDQRGKTPPTASQWLDELVRAQRRMTTPGASFWREFCAEVVMRFHFLGTSRGLLPKIEAAGRVISVAPHNPAQRAADLDQVQTAQNFVAFANTAFPQIAQTAIDPLATLAAVKAKLGDRLVSLNTAQQMQAALSQFSDALKSGAGPGPYTPPPNQDIGGQPPGAP